MFEKVSRRSNIDIFSEEDGEEPAPKIGFFTALALGLGLAENNSSHKHNGKCNGNCAN